MYRTELGNCGDSPIPASVTINEEHEAVATKSPWRNSKHRTQSTTTPADGSSLAVATIEFPAAPNISFLCCRTRSASSAPPVILSFFRTNPALQRAPSLDSSGSPRSPSVVAPDPPMPLGSPSPSSVHRDPCPVAATLTRFVLAIHARPTHLGPR